MSGQQPRPGAERPTPPGGGLGRERIVDAAVGLIATEGVEALTMRRLARRLGTAPMSLYRHVDSKAELLGLVVERVAEGLPAVAAAGPWDVTVREILVGIRQVLVRHPGIGAAVTSEALFTPSALSVVETLLGALHAAGLGEAAAARTFAVLWNYTLGSVMVEQALLAGAGAPGEAASGQGATEAALAEQRRRIVEAMQPLVTGAPEVRAAAAHWLHLGTGEAFEAGLDLLLAGVEASAGH